MQPLTEYAASLREAEAVRPIQASQVQGKVDAAAAHRAREGHWVNQLSTSARWPVDDPAAVPLWMDLTARRSQLGNGPAGWDPSAQLLIAMAHVHASGEDAAGRSWSSRLSPSAGGTHSIRPVLYYSGIGTGWFRAADEHAVEEVELTQAGALLRNAEAALGTTGTAFLFAIAEPEVIAARYPLGASLLWRDAGAFLATAQNVAIALGLSARILGIATSLEGERRPISAHVVGALAVAAPMLEAL